MNAGARVKGWCPSAYRPMMSGDGLIVRVKPFFGELSPTQTLELCRLAKRFGNGSLDLTSRANLQVRGVSEADYDDLLQALIEAGLVGSDPETEARRNVLVSPFWGAGDLTHRLTLRLYDALPQCPELPDKFGFSVDTGDRPVLRGASADLRIERGGEGHLVLRANGSDKVRVESEETIIPAIAETLDWFCDTGGMSSKRMVRHLREHALPSNWRLVHTLTNVCPLKPGKVGAFNVLGAPLGTCDADALSDLMLRSEAAAFRPMPGRLFALKSPQACHSAPYISAPDDPALQIHACPGAPACAQAQVETRALALSLAPKVSRGKTLHVSGCAKGCAHPRNADVTLVGRDGAFDLVRAGAPWDEPLRHGLNLAQLTDLNEF